MFNGGFAYLIEDLFPTRIRYSGVALSLNLGITLFSGAAPLLATFLAKSASGQILPGHDKVA